MKKKSAIPFFLIVIILISISIAAFSLIPIINTEGFVEANILEVQGNTIILGKDCLAIVADTSEERAKSIEDGLQKMIIGRPNTHDIFVATLKAFNITVDSIQISKFEGGVYYADINIISGDKVLKLDSKPSDAIAIAVRTNATILIDQNLLNAYGHDICI